MDHTKPPGTYYEIVCPRGHLGLAFSPHLQTLPQMSVSSCSASSFSFFNLSFNLAVLGLCCCTRSGCGKWGLLFITVCELLIVASSLIVEHGF